MHKEQIILLTDPVYSWETEKQWIWQDDAACAFSPPTMFEVAVPSDAIADGDGTNEVHDLNAANFEAANKICGTCPVLPECYSSSAEEDFRWTMRAGVIPTNHAVTHQGRPRKHPMAIDTSQPCKEGHLDWKISKGGGTYCGPCKVAYNKISNAKRGNKPRKAAVTIQRGEVCQFGHDAWTKNGVGKGGNQHYQCRPCKNERDRVARQKSREAGILAG